MNKKLRSAALLYGAAKYSTVFVTLLTASVLARLISPAEYGIVTVVTVFLSLFTVLADMGLGNAVIQNKTLTKEEIDGIFSLSVYISVALALVFAMLGFPISVIYGNRVYVKICAMLSAAVFFSTMNIMPSALLMRDKRFALVGKRLICISVFVGATSILLAYLGMSYYTIVIQQVLQSMLTFLWNRVNVTLHFHWRIHLSGVRKIGNYSIYQVLYYLVNNVARNLDNMLIGKFMGSEPLAHYDKGYRLMMYPVQNLTMVINPIVHPILSDHQNDRRYIYDSYMKLAKVLSLAGLFVSAVCFWGAREIILLFFGSQWESAVPVFCILSLSVWPQMVASSASSVYQSTGNTRLMFQSGMVHFSVAIAMIIAGVATGSLETVAKLVALSLYFRFFIDYYILVTRNFGYSYGAFLKAFLPDVVIAAALALAIAVLSPMVGGLSGLVSLFVKGCLMLAVFAVGLKATGQLALLRGILKRD